VIGAYAYVQSGELSHQKVEPGQIWIRAGDGFDFSYSFPPEVLERYIRLEPGEPPQGVFMDFVEARKEDFQSVFDSVHSIPSIEAPPGALVSRYALIKGESSVGENVLVAQRAYLEDAHLGKGANAQENCYIIHSVLEGYNVTAHGGKIIYAHLGEKGFVGFNAFLRGSPECPLKIGEKSIVMPHTIIDLQEPLEIPAGHLIWGYIRHHEDLKNHSIALEELMNVTGELESGSMVFRGSGVDFVHAFQKRIEHILEDNGAYFDGARKMGHAQKGQHISFNTIQPYPEGTMKGIYPTIDIRP
jgi:carbonic anhydrase/acetyltransferase-like protein (isoleucine patch superfamily)